MIIVIIILIYIVTLFISRYIDIKLQIHKDPIHYKKHIQSGIWFIPVVNLFRPIIDFLSYEVETRKLDIKHNKFINWFFVGVNYQTKASKKAEKEFDDFLNFKNTHEERDMRNPNTK